MPRHVVLVAVLSALLVLLPRAHAADHPLAGRIWLPAQERFVSADTLAAMARQADAVLLGEIHDNAEHHALQAWVLARILEGGRRPLVAFEMFDADQGPALRDYLAAHPGDAAGLGPAVGWGGWPDWSLYRPIAQAALDAGAPLVPANLPRTAVRALLRGETPAIAEGLGLERPQPDAQRRTMEEAIQDGHCRRLPRSALPGMVRVQRARDAVMARALADGLATQGAAVLIAGAGHVRNDVGVPVHLAEMAPGRQVLAVIFQEVRDDGTDAAAYAVAADAVWFTPMVGRGDPCDGLRGR